MTDLEKYGRHLPECAYIQPAKEPWREVRCTCAPEVWWGDHRVGCPRSEAFHKWAATFTAPPCDCGFAAALEQEAQTMTMTVEEIRRRMGAQPEYTAEHMIGQNWGVIGSNDEGRYVVTGVAQDQAEYTAMLLNAGMDRAEAVEGGERTECFDCGRRAFAAELDADLRCVGCGH